MKNMQIFWKHIAISKCFSDRYKVKCHFFPPTTFVLRGNASSQGIVNENLESAESSEYYFVFVQ